MVLYCQKCGRLIGRMELAKLDGKNYCLRCFKKLGGKGEDDHALEEKVFSAIGPLSPTGITIAVAIGTAAVAGALLLLILWIMN